jgi:hypothetical protein
MLMGMTTTITHLAGLEFFYWYFISIYTKIHLTEESSFINVTKTEASVIGTYPKKKRNWYIFLSIIRLQHHPHRFQALNIRVVREYVTL